MTELRGDITAFVAGNEDSLRALSVLSATESATDDLGIYLLEISGWSLAQAEAFVDAIHRCDFVLEENREWWFAPDARRPLIEALTANEQLSRHVHSSLLEVATEKSESGFEGKLPQYLRSAVGQAYHGVFLGKADALKRYALIAEAQRSGQQWLASRLAQEQVELRIIPAGALEVLLLQGMVMYREGRFDAAAAVLRRVVETNEVRREVAVGAHILGHIVGRESAGNQKAVALLEKSVDISKVVLGPKHPQTLDSKIRLGNAYYAEGDPGRATQLFEETLEAQKHVLGPEHPQTLYSQNMLALAYQATGNTGRALQLFERTLEAREHMFGRDDLRTVESRWNLGTAYMAAGDEILGNILRNEAATVARKSFPSHPLTAALRRSLA
jgi:tetratricopeptide (TPR) repeat protein